MRRWETLRPELDAREVGIVTVSGDAPAAIRKGRAKHGAQATMLADKDLSVTDRFNLRNEGNVTPTGYRAMPIPTTILVDAAGIVRWIDQAQDYQTRSHPDRVLGAIQQHLA